jgi:glycosyltransferase involved in cell wall biosynthesis
MNPRFSICIPNYNYGSYISETIESILNQDFKDFEICIADNASTDNSWDIIKTYVKNHHNIKAVQNKFNVGYAGNLDVVTTLATGDWHIMLSSDDLMYAGALSIYNRIINDHDNNSNVLINSGYDKFENESPENKTYFGLNKNIWKNLNPINPTDNIKIYKESSEVLLHNGILNFRSPFNFDCLCYSKELYEKANGYGSSRIMNPDKWFHWKIAAKSEYAVFIDIALFGYRWHNQNQTALQNQSGILKYWLDELRNCYETTDDLLDFAKLTREQVELSFLRKIIINYGYSSLAYGMPLKSMRIVAFGVFSYPKKFFKSGRALILLIAILLYPLTWLISKIASSYFLKRK